eukprot:903615-Amphidinium_carterae.3
MVYRVWAAWQKHRITDWRALCTSQGETPVGKGALDEAFTLAAEAERATAKSEPFAAVFLDCSKCYERVDLDKLERASMEHYPTPWSPPPASRQDAGLRWTSSTLSSSTNSTPVT